MFTMMMMMLISAVVASLVAALAILLNQKSQMDREKMSPFECGFDPQKKARAPFSLRFFLITILFLIFDVEIVFLLPLGVVTLYSPITIALMLALMITIVLLVGLLHEWNQGVLNWVS